MRYCNQHHLKQRKPQNNLVKIKNEQSSPLAPLIFNILFEALAAVIIQEKQMKGIQIQKEHIKLSLFTDDRTLFMRDSTNTPQNFQTVSMGLAVQQNTN